MFIELTSYNDLSLHFLIKKKKKKKKIIIKRTSLMYNELQCILKLNNFVYIFLPTFHFCRVNINGNKLISQIKI